METCVYERFFILIFLFSEGKPFFFCRFLYNRVVFIFVLYFFRGDL